MRRWSPRKRRHLRGLARVFFYFTVIGIVSAAFSVRAARAEMKTRTLELGRQMMQLARASNHDVTPVRFNGQQMLLASSTTDDAAKDVLDRYEAHCEGSLKVLRSGDDREGTVVCFVKGAETKASLREAFEAFAETGELGYLGKLRFAYARRNPGTGRTLVLTAWTEDTFNLVDMMPAEGKDAPGADFAEVPRVPNATRALSVRAEGLPYGLNVYQTKDEGTLAFYDVEMTRLGYKGVDPELDEVEVGGRGRAYVRDGVVVTVASHRHEGSNFVMVGLAGVQP